MNAAAELSPTRRRWLLAAVMSGLLLAMLDQSIVGTALPAIVETLGGSSLYVWVATAYLVPATVSLPIYARLSDRHGRRALLLIGMVLFLAGSGAGGDGAEHGAADRAGARCRASARARWKASRSSSSPTSTPAAAAPRMQGALAGLMGITFIAGPLIGGFLTDHVGWRSVFTVNLPIGVAALAVVAHRRCPPRSGAARAARTPLDLAGHRAADARRRAAADRARTSATVALDRAAASLVVAVFLGVERRAVAPIIPLQLFADRKIAAILVAGATSTFGLFAGALLLPRYFQQVRDVSATHSGLLIYPLLLGLLLSVNVAGMVIARRLEFRGTVVAGAGLAALGALGFATFDAEHARLAEPDLHGPDRPRHRARAVRPADRPAALGRPGRRSAARWARCCCCARSAAPSRWRAPRPSTAPATTRPSPRAPAC